MAYTRVNWVDLPATTTPVDAANLNVMDSGIAAAATTATTLDQFAAAAANVALGSHKITGLANGSASSDAAAFGQIPATLQPTDPGTSKVWGSTGSGASVGVFPPGYQWDRKTVTTGTIAVTATTEGTANTLATGNSVTYDGTEVKVEFWAPRYSHAGDLALTFVVLRDATVVGQAASEIVSGGSIIPKIECFDTPAAGAHTYAVKAFVSSGTVNVSSGVGGSGTFLPLFMRVTKA